MEDVRTNDIPKTGIPPVSSSIPEAIPFCATASELTFALLSFVFAFFYSKTLLHPYYEERAYWLLLLTATLVLTVEYLNRKIRHGFESMMTLACFLICSLTLSFNMIYGRSPIFPEPYQLERIWNEGQMLLFIHIFFVWYVIARSGKMLEGRSGHLLPVDVVDAAVIIPFGNIFLRIKTVIWGIKTFLSSKQKEEGRPFPWMSVAAVLVSGVLLIMATSLLMDADDRFYELFRKLGDLFQFEMDEILSMEIIFSIPVGAWLWGLIGGSFRYPIEKLEERKGLILSFLETLKKVSASVWTFIIGAFSVIYLIFFVIQANYLFGAFFGRLPEGFIVSEYARSGFFELCKLTALNFFLLWMTTRTADKKTRDSKLFKLSCLLLLCENMLFALIAISKLCLYISIFGITPLRIQSSWFAAVLFAGCLMWIYSILREKQTFRYWVYFGAISLALLTVI